MRITRCLSIVFFLSAVSMVRTQQIFNPVNNLPPPGQSGGFGPPPGNRLPTFTPPSFTPPSFTRSTSRTTTRFPQFGGNVYTTLPPPPRIQQNSYSVRQVIAEAVEKVRAEDAIMSNRVNRGIDRYASDLQTPDPLLFSESPENATIFSVQSRRINWISRLLKKNNMRQSLASVLSSPEAAQYSVSCPFVAPRNCDAVTRYRTVDGTCNNLDNPLWGAAFIPFERLLPAAYEADSERDDLPQSRGRHGRPLRSARDISTSFHEPPRSVVDDSRFSFLLTVFGQFLAHDVTDRAPTKGYRETVLKCCNQTIATPSGVCDNIPIPIRDTFRQFKGDCLEFARSAEVTDLNCRSGKREQLNQASSYIDGGAIYGATREKAASLRLFSGGLLMTSEPNQLPIFPPNNPHASARGFAFYAVGDNRVNEFIGLIGMETIWVREHNRIAKRLSELNRNWPDRIIFEETRRIIIAILQHITYNEYLPAVLGKQLMRDFRLNPLDRGFYHGYSSQKNPGLTNSFATAAMRFGHSMLRTFYTLRDRSNADSGDPAILLRDSFFKPQQFLMHQNAFMRGMAQDPSKLCDRVFSTGVVNNLYETIPGTGADLAAANTQRSRDHGLPSYAEFRRRFTMPIPRRFDNSLLGFPHHDFDTMRRLEDLYSSAEDVELFAGAISETPITDGAVGPTIGHILAQQFQSIREGDRFWYETPTYPQGFIIEQLTEIRKVTLARILCDTFSFELIQPNAFLVPDFSGNRPVSCADIPNFDLTLWTTA